jgi:hypothetical protein
MSWNLNENSHSLTTDRQHIVHELKSLMSVSSEVFNLKGETYSSQKPGDLMFGKEGHGRGYGHDRACHLRWGRYRRRIHRCHTAMVMALLHVRRSFGYVLWSVVTAGAWVYLVSSRYTLQ